MKKLMMLAVAAALLSLSTMASADCRFRGVLTTCEDACIDCTNANLTNKNLECVISDGGTDGTLAELELPGVVHPMRQGQVDALEKLGQGPIRCE